MTKEGRSVKTSPVCLEFNAPQLQALLLARAVDVVKAETARHRLWKDFRVLPPDFFQALAVFRQIFKTGLVVGFTLKGQTDMLMTTGWSAWFRFWRSHHPTELNNSRRHPSILPSEANHKIR